MFLIVLGTNHFNYFEVPLYLLYKHLKVRNSRWCCPFDQCIRILALPYFFRACGTSKVTESIHFALQPLEEIRDKAATTTCLWGCRAFKSFFCDIKDGSELIPFTQLNEKNACFIFLRSIIYSTPKKNTDLKLFIVVNWVQIEKCWPQKSKEKI